MRQTRLRTVYPTIFEITLPHTNYNQMCFLFVVVYFCFSLGDFFNSDCKSDSLRMQHDFMLRSSVYFQSGDVTPHSSYMWLVRGGQTGDWSAVVAVAACDEAVGEGGGTIKAFTKSGVVHSGGGK